MAPSGLEAFKLLINVNISGQIQSLLLLVERKLQWDSILFFKYLSVNISSLYLNVSPPPFSLLHALTAAIIMNDVESDTYKIYILCHF